MIWTSLCKSLQVEFTIIPTVLNACRGKYENTLWNGIAWLLASWYFFHAIFDHFLSVLLRKFRCRHYTEIQLKYSLWNLILYSAILIYSFSILAQSNVEIFTLKLSFDNTTALSRRHVLGFILMTTAIFHSATWDVLKQYHAKLASSYVGLFLYLSFCYYLGSSESSFKLIAAVCTAQVVLQVTRCTKLLTGKDQGTSEVLTKTLLAFSIFTSVLVYIFMICTLLDNTLIEKKNYSTIFLSLILLLWLLLDVYSSVVLRLIVHWLNHDAEEERAIYNGNILDCCLFLQRDDAAYNYGIFRRAMKEREAKKLSMRKPRNNNRMLFQTLKCMAAIKNKLIDKRKSLSKTGSENASLTHDSDEQIDQNIESNVIKVVDTEQLDGQKIKED